jgi:hypothetical protein
MGLAQIVSRPDQDARGSITAPRNGFRGGRGPGALLQEGRCRLPKVPVAAIATIVVVECQIHDATPAKLLRGRMVFDGTLGW